MPDNHEFERVLQVSRPPIILGPGQLIADAQIGVDAQKGGPSDVIMFPFTNKYNQLNGAPGKKVTVGWPEPQGNGGSRVRYEGGDLYERPTRLSTWCTVPLETSITRSAQAMGGWDFQLPMRVTCRKEVEATGSTTARSTGGQTLALLQLTTSRCPTRASSALLRLLGTGSRTQTSHIRLSAW